MTLKTKSVGFLVLLLASILSVSVRAGAAAPSYSVSVGNGSFSPNPICAGMTATAKLSTNLNVQNPNQEIQESGDNWNWSASVTGYAPSSQSAYGAVPSGVIPPSVGAPSGSPTSTVTASASQTTSPGYYQVTVTAADSFKLTDSSTSPATVTSQSQSGSTTLYITVVALDRIQYNDPQNGWIACPSPLYVMKGTSVQFKAIPSPADASFPSGQPTWSGAATGSGATASAIFSSASSSLSDYKTATATCGNSVSCNGVVYTLTPALSPQDFFVNRSLIQYGLGEVTYLNFTALPAVTSAQIGGLKWFLSNGGDSALTSGVDGTGTLTCSSSPSSPIITLQIFNGPSSGKSVASSISVIAPSNAYAVHLDNVAHTQYLCSVFMHTDAYYLPKTVSFSHLQWRESDVAASIANGCFTNSNNNNGSPPDTSHHANSVWIAASPTADESAENGGLGTFVNEVDTAGFSVPNPDNGGELTWPIPWNYRVVKSDGSYSASVQFATAVQDMNATSAGAASVSKKGVGPYSKAYGDATSGF